MASPRLIPRVTYRASLIGPVSTNKHRSVNFSIDGTCFTISDLVKPRQKPPLIANVTFPYVFKVCKASERTRSKGQPNMLDLVIHTKQGLRDLRLCFDSERTVDSIISRFRVNAARYMELSRRAFDLHGATPTFSKAGSFMSPYPGPPSPGASSAHSAPLQRVVTFRPGSPLATVQSESAPLQRAWQARSVRASESARLVFGHLSGTPTAEEVVAMAVSGSPSMQPEVLARPVAPQQEADAPAAPRKPEWAVDTQKCLSKGHPEGQAVTLQVETQTSLVSEVARCGEAADQASAQRSTAANTEASSHANVGTANSGLSLARGDGHNFLESMVARLAYQLAALQQETGGNVVPVPSASALREAGLSPLPECLSDASALTPLLLAYDRRIGALNSALDARKSELSAFKLQVDEVVAENGALSEKLQEAVAFVKSQQELEVAPCPNETEAERACLLQRENSLLVQHNSELEGQLTHLREEIARAEERALDATQEAATVTSSLRAKEAEALKLANAVDALRKQATDQEAHISQLQTTCDHTGSVKNELCVLQSRHEALLSQHAAVVAGADEAEATVAALQIDLDTALADAVAAQREGAAHEQAGTELRGMVQSLQARIAEYQAKDVEVYTRVREAMEVAERNKLARDAAAARGAQLESEVETLRDRLARTSAASAGATPSGAAHAQAARRELEHAQRSIAELENSVADHKASNARLDREKSALREQLGALAARGGGAASAEAVENLRRALDAQRERDRATQEAESLRRTFSRHRLESEVRARQLEGRVEELKSQLATLAAASSTSRSDAERFLKQLESTRRELASLKLTRRKREHDLRARVASLRAERAAEVQMLAGKLEESLSAYNKSAGEAERMLAAKETLLGRYKEEAQNAAAKLETAEGHVKAKEQEIAGMKHAIAATQLESNAIRRELENAWVTAEEGRAAADRAHAAGADAASLRMLRNDEARRRRSADQEFEAAHLSQARGERAAEDAKLHIDSVPI